jgi:hypothetical protein
MTTQFKDMPKILNPVPKRAKQHAKDICYSEHGTYMKEGLNIVLIRVAVVILWTRLHESEKTCQ